MVELAALFLTKWALLWFKEAVRPDVIFEYLNVTAQREG